MKNVTCSIFIISFHLAQLLSNMQKITCATFNEYSLMMASYYQILRKLFVFFSQKTD